jgi:hypothetical protein
MAYCTKNKILAWNPWPGGYHPLRSSDILGLIRQFDFDKIILCNQLEWQYWSFPEYNEIIHELYKQNKKLIVINGAEDIIIPHPTWNIELHKYPLATSERAYYRMFENEMLAQYNVTKEQRIIMNIESLDYKFHFISMNRKAHKHRMQTIDLLAKYNLIDKNSISWHNVEPGPYTYKHFVPKIMNLTDDYAKTYEQATVPREYYHSFAQLVPETTTECFMITEKTATPIMIGKPFLSVSCAFFHKYLQDLGFELYDEIFDYSFDTVFDDQSRFEMVVQNFVNLSKIPLPQLNDLAKKIKDKVEYNKSIFNKLIFENKNHPYPVQEILDIYYNDGLEIDNYTVNQVLRLERVRP